MNSRVRLNVVVGDTVWYAGKAYGGSFVPCCGSIVSIAWQRLRLSTGIDVPWNESYTDRGECERRVQNLNKEANPCDSP